MKAEISLYETVIEKSNLLLNICAARMIKKLQKNFPVTSFEQKLPHVVFLNCGSKNINLKKDNRKFRRNKI